MSWLSDTWEDLDDPSEEEDDDDYAPSDQLSDMLDDVQDEESAAYDEMLADAWSEEELDYMPCETDLGDYG